MPQDLKKIHIFLDIIKLQRVIMADTQEQFVVKSIHELDTLPYSGDAYVPVDNGTALGKLPLSGIAPDKIAVSSIAPQFDSSINYKKNELVTYGSTLYRFNQAHTGDWNESDVDAVSIAQLLKEQNMKKFTIWASTGVAYTLTGNARSAAFSPAAAGILETYAISSMNNNVALLDGTKSARIIGAMVKAGGGFGTQPASGEKAANLVLELIAVATDGTAVGDAIATYNVQLADWGTWESKDISLALPDSVPAGAVGFGFNMAVTTEFTCDDYNIQRSYVGQTIVPEVLFEIETDGMTEMSTGSVIN